MYHLRQGRGAQIDRVNGDIQPKDTELGHVYLKKNPAVAHDRNAGRISDMQKRWHVNMVPNYEEDTLDDTSQGTERFKM